jgi:hypothetical protein
MIIGEPGKAVLSIFLGLGPLPHQGFKSAYDREPSSLSLDRDMGKLPHLVCDFFMTFFIIING